MQLTKYILIASTALVGIVAAMQCGVSIHERKPVQSVVMGLSALAATGLSIAVARTPGPGESWDEEG